MNINQSQILAFGRHVVTFGSGAIFYASIFGVVDGANASKAAAAIAQISHGFNEVVGGVFVLIPIGMGVIAAVKTSPLVQMVVGAAAMLHGQANPLKMSAADQTTIMEAVGKLPKVDAVVTNDKAIAATTSPSVVSSDQVTIKKAA